MPRQHGTALDYKIIFFHRTLNSARRMACVHLMNICSMLCFLLVIHCMVLAQNYCLLFEPCYEDRILISSLFFLWCSSFWYPNSPTTIYFYQQLNCKDLCPNLFCLAPSHVSTLFPLHPNLEVFFSMLPRHSKGDIDSYIRRNSSSSRAHPQASPLVAKNCNCSNAHGKIPRQMGTLQRFYLLSSKPSG